MGKILSGCCEYCGRFEHRTMRLPGGRLCRRCENRILSVPNPEVMPDLLSVIYRLISPGILDGETAKR